MSPESSVEVVDAIDLLDSLEDDSIDLLLTDPPAGVTQAKWDDHVDLDAFWKAVLRPLKPKGVVIITAVQPFASKVVLSNQKHYKCEWVWEKSKATAWMNAKHQPLRAHEHVLVFYRQRGTYNPQMTDGEPYTKGTAYRPTDVYGTQIETTVTNTTGKRYPRSVQYFKTAEAEGPVVHPTQKPVALFEYFIRTYSNPGDLVVDPFVGVGTTAVACANTGRRFICGDVDSGYVNIAHQRLTDVQERPTFSF